ncbi:hypothetical protein HYS72_00310 [Candidatus Pacearchaeota archaeon]|nr:hypothetical protein [Candidatus Pacearchaeota archaeon]
MTTPKPTPEQIKEAKERMRKIALKNLKALNLMNLASAFLVEESGAYGEGGGSAVEQFKYFPSFNSALKGYDLKSGEERNLFTNSLLASRQGAGNGKPGKRYSGNLSEYGMMQECSEIMQASLNQIKVSDLYSELMGGSKTLPKEMGDKYIGELRPQITQAELDKLTDDKKKIFQENAKIYKVLTDSYETYLTDKIVSESLGERKAQNLKGLEEILMGEGR